MTSTVSPNSAVWVLTQCSAKSSTDSSPTSRRWVCTASSKRFMATWRNTVAMLPSTCWASSANRSAGSSVWSSRRSKVTVSPNTDAVSASVSGVDWWKIPWGRARWPCTA